MKMITLPPVTSLNQPALIIESLDRDERIVVGDGAAIYPASMIKLPIALAAAVALDSGVIDDGPILIADRLMTANDAPSPFVPGYTAEVWELIEAMLAFSDNVATNALIDRIGRLRATAICERAGLRGTAIRRFLSGSLPRIADLEATGENEHPPEDAALLLQQIANGAVPSADQLLAALAKQHWNDKLSAGLQVGDRFAHKTGDTSDTSHDGGILTTHEGQKYVIVLYSGSPSNPETDAAFAQFMRALRPQL